MIFSGLTRALTISSVALLRPRSITGCLLVLVYNQSFELISTLFELETEAQLYLENDSHIVQILLISELERNGFCEAKGGLIPKSNRNVAPFRFCPGDSTGHKGSAVRAS